MAIEDCDVFLSFRGETRNNFTCYLYEELKRQGFQPFMDRENIGIGDEIQGIIKKAIKYSKSAIIVLSYNYASSTHCLNELLYILERNRTSRYFIIPIFYYVEAADVKYQLGKFGDSFDHLNKRHNNEKVDKWRAALAEVGDILAKEINEKDPRTESKIIEDIVTSFRQKYSEHYPEPKASNDIISNDLVPKTSSIRFDIEEGTLEITKDNLKSITNNYEEFRSWMKDWMINNPKFVIIIVIVLTIIIIYTVFAFIEITIIGKYMSSTTNTLTSFFEKFPTDMGMETNHFGRSELFIDGKKMDEEATNSFFKLFPDHMNSPYKDMAPLTMEQSSWSAAQPWESYDSLGN